MFNKRFFESKIKQEKELGSQSVPALVTSSCNARRYGICGQFKIDIFRGQKKDLGVNVGVKDSNKYPETPNFRKKVRGHNWVF